VLWFGWFGFNMGPSLTTPVAKAGTIAALSMVNTTLSGGCAGISALLFNMWRVERMTGEPIFDLTKAMNGSLAGLAAVTAGCGVVEPFAAVLIGLVAGILYVLASAGLVHFEIDDAVDAVPVHCVGGLWGLIAVGLFASPTRLDDFYGNGGNHPGWFYLARTDGGSGRLMGIQLVGILFIVGWTAFFMYPFFSWLDYRGWFRADALDEIVGLDVSYHKSSAGFLDQLVAANEVDASAVEAYRARKANKLAAENDDEESSGDGNNADPSTEEDRMTL